MAEPHLLAETSSRKIPEKCLIENSDWLGTGHMPILEPIMIPVAPNSLPGGSEG